MIINNPLHPIPVYVRYPAFCDEKSVQLVRVAFSEMTSYKIHTLEARAEILTKFSLVS